MRIDPNHWSIPEMRRVVVHEFGHSLGLLHEQSYPGAVNWKRTDSIYNYYRKHRDGRKSRLISMYSKYPASFIQMVPAMMPNQLCITPLIPGKQLMDIL